MSTSIFREVGFRERQIVAKSLPGSSEVNTLGCIDHDCWLAHPRGVPKNGRSGIHRMAS
jgi:hypothetical protein